MPKEEECGSVEKRGGKEGGGSISNARQQQCAHLVKLVFIMRREKVRCASLGKGDLFGNENKSLHNACPRARAWRNFAWVKGGGVS